MITDHYDPQYSVNSTISQGSKFLTKLSFSRQGSEALKLQEAKFGVLLFHDSRASYFQHTKFPGSKIHGPTDPYRESPKIQSFR